MTKDSIDRRRAISGLARAAVASSLLSEEAFSQTTDGARIEPGAQPSLVGSAASIGTADGMTVQQVLDIVTGPAIHAARFGVVGDGSTDNTAALSAALLEAHATGGVLILPKGTILSGDLGNLAKSGVTIAGAGKGVTVLKAMHGGTAFRADAFEGRGVNDQFVHDFGLRDLTFEGNAATTDILWAQGIARSEWDVEAREAGGRASKAFHMRGCMSNTMTLLCSTNRKRMVHPPQFGLFLDVGSRAGISVGASSNNTFLRCMMEGLPNGCHFASADQNLFLGGAMQGSSNLGLLISGSSRFNTFLGVGFENAASIADVLDRGTSTSFTNCYSAKAFILRGSRPIVRGGYFERIQIDDACDFADIAGVAFNHWATERGGWFDSGSSTRWRALFDARSGRYHYPQRRRVPIAVGSSPFEWQNLTGAPVSVSVSSGSVSKVEGRRGSDAWIESNSGPSAHLVAPGDSLVVTYSQRPELAFVLIDGF